VLEGRVEPGRVFDRTIEPKEVPDGYRAMDECKGIKVMAEPCRRKTRICGTSA